VKVYLDTSVLVAALLEDHPQHARAVALLLSAADGKSRACVAAHGLVELYSVLTRTPFVPRIHPAEARQMIERSVLPRVDVVALTAVEYRQVICDCADSGVSGGAVCDAIHLRAARKAGCERICTLNVRDFRALAAEDLQDRIGAP
jgi:predicted nucleic acid-binding protein